VALLLVIPAAFAWACGGDDASTGDGGGVDSGNDSTIPDTGGKDTTPPSDTGPGDTGPGDTGPTDTGTNDTGTSDTGVSDAGSSFACTKPSDCDASFCCGTIVFNGGTLPNCKLEDASSMCNTTCKSNVALSCTATDTVRSCVAHADCADAGNGYTDCCDVPFGDAAVEFCWSKTLANLINGSSCL
jgi:hypothetical protein